MTKSGISNPTQEEGFPHTPIPSGETAYGPQLYLSEQILAIHWGVELETNCSVTEKESRDVHGQPPGRHVCVAPALELWYASTEQIPEQLTLVLKTLG